MFFRLLMESFRRQRRRKLLAGIAILLGTTAVTAMLALATTIGDRIHKELAVYGANIIVYPKADQLEVKVGGVDIKPASSGTYLKESDLAKLKTIFWANNITGISPELPISLTITPQSSSTTTPGGPSFAQSHRAKGGVSFAEANDSSPQPSDPAPPVQIRALGLWFNHDFGGLNTGAPMLHPIWKLTGTWPVAENEIVLGSGLALKLNLQRRRSSSPQRTRGHSRVCWTRDPVR